MKLAPVASPVRRVSYWCPDPGNAETALSGLPGAGTGRSRRIGGLAPPWHDYSSEGCIGQYRSGPSGSPKQYRAFLVGNR
jgi:hypothetical protein